MNPPFIIKFTSIQAFSNGEPNMTPCAQKVAHLSFRLPMITITTVLLPLVFCCEVEEIELVSQMHGWSNSELPHRGLCVKGASTCPSMPPNCFMLCPWFLVPVIMQGIPLHWERTQKFSCYAKPASQRHQCKERGEGGLKRYLVSCPKLICRFSSMLQREIEIIVYLLSALFFGTEKKSGRRNG